MLSLFLFFSFFLAVKRESAPTPPPSLPKSTMTEEEMEKKANAITEEYLHINDLKVQTQQPCMRRCEFSTH